MEKIDFPIVCPELEKMITSTIEAGRKERFDALKNKVKRGIGVVALLTSSVGTGPAVDFGQYIGLINKDAQRSGTVQVLDDFRGMTGCKKATDDIPQEVTLQFDVFNHTQGYRNQFSRTVLGGDSLAIKVSDLGINDVDPQRIAIRQDNFGGLVTYSATGEVTFMAPKQSANYDIILFNSSNNAPYSWMDRSNLVHGTRNFTVYRQDFDGQTGPESIWENVFNQLNSALDLGWVKWGSINRQPNATNGNFSYGYGSDSHGGSGWHQGNLIIINPKLCSNELVMTLVGLAEAFENICGVDDIGGHSSSMTIQTNGVLNPVGKDLFAYVFAKDGAN